MRILVTGDTGLIGSALCQQLIKDNHQVFGMSREKPSDKFNYKHIQKDLVTDDIEFLIHGIDPAIVVHLAAITKVKEYNHDVSKANILATHKLLDNVPPTVKFIFASSVTVYGEHNTPRSLEHKVNPSSVYGLSKLFCENLIKLYAESYNKIQSYSILRYVAHIGNNARHGVMYDVIRKLESDSEYLELIGHSPGSRKPYIHIEDSVAATISSFYTHNSVFNVGPSGNVDILEVANVIMDELNIQKPIKWLGATGDWVGDDKYVSIIPSFFCRPSESSIRDYVKSYKKSSSNRL